MGRAFLIVMDSAGIGGALDAADFFNGSVPDTGANTLGHIAQACAAGKAEDGRSGPLHVPTLDGLGLGRALALADGVEVAGLGAEPLGAWGAGNEVSNGKDTPSGHWEMAGVPVPFDWHIFPNTQSAFDPELTAAIAQAAGTEGILANRYASGTEVLEDEGAEHVRSGWPICYTSVDSVIQIAAHEEVFGLERLLTLCETLAPMVHKMGVGRVIARPFLGSEAEGWKRTVHRRDYAMEPPELTICDVLHGAGHPVHAVGKIGDIFSMRGIDDVVKGADATLMEGLGRLVDQAADGAFVFANFVEFDSLYGHRRDVSGYARHLEWFDVELSALMPRFREGDLVILTADHGNDPTWTGTDHTRERVLVLCHGIGVRGLGQLNFVDIAATVADHLHAPAMVRGRSFL